MAGELLADICSKSSGKQVVLSGIRIGGPVNLEATDVRSSIVFVGCYFDSALLVDGAAMRSLQLNQCMIPLLSAYGTTIAGDFWATDCTVGHTRLGGIHISGALRTSGTTFCGASWPDNEKTQRSLERLPQDAVDASHAQIGSNADFSETLFRIPLVVSSANIGGFLDMGNSRFEGRSSDGLGLVANRTETGGGVVLSGATTTRGGISMMGASIAGQLTLDGAALGGADHDGDSLALHSSSIGRGIFGRKDLLVKGGALNGYGTTIGGACELDGAILDGVNTYGRSLDLSYVQLTGDLSMTKAQSHGSVSISAATINGDCSFEDSHFTSTAVNDPALDAAGARVTGSLSGIDLRLDGGPLALMSSTVDGVCSFRGLRVTQGDEDGDAVLGDRGNFHSGLSICGPGAHLAGALRLHSADVGVQLLLTGIRFTSISRRSEALVLTACSVAGSVHLDAISSRDRCDVLVDGMRVSGRFTMSRSRLPWGSVWRFDTSSLRSLFLGNSQRDGGYYSGYVVDLSGAHAGLLVDDPSDLPLALSLRGFTFDSLPVEPGEVKDRLKWIGRSCHSTGFSTEPYSQFAAYYRRSGREPDARVVSLARDRAVNALLPRRRRLLGWALDAVAGYGYLPLRAAAWLLGLWVLGYLAARHGFETGQLTPVRRGVQEFVPSVFAFDRLAPIVTLGMRDSYVPHGDYRSFFAAYTVAGWLFTTAVVAAITHNVRKS